MNFFDWYQEEGSYIMADGMKDREFKEKIWESIMRLTKNATQTGDDPTMGGRQLYGG